MEAIVSGQAGLAVVLGPKPQLRMADGTVRSLGRSGNIDALFEHCFDAVQRTVKNVRDVDKLLRSAWEADRALRLALMLFEEDLPKEDRIRIAGLVEKLIVAPAAASSLLARLCAAQLPVAVLQKTEDDLQGEPTRIAGIIRDLVGLQEGIGRARWSFDQLDPALFESLEHRNGLLSALVIDGAFRDLAKALSEGTSVAFLSLALRGKHRNLPNGFALIDAWLSPFTNGGGSIQREAMTADIPEVPVVAPAANTGQAARRAFERAMGQQATVVEKVRTGEFDTARRFVDDLVREQSQSNAPQYIAKSLSRLSHIAKEMDVPDLQLEWASKAVEIYPDDPKTHGHLADALIGLRRFGEAEASLSESERLGDELYAATGRARMLRLSGKFTDALDAYLRAAERYRDQPEAVHALKGAAETMRDMGRVDDALKAYEEYGRRYPLEGMFALGVANSLADLGDISAARKAYGVATAKFSGGPAASNGQAALAKAVGDFTSARKLYSGVLETYPYNAVARCGLGDLMRLSGEYTDAIGEYDKVIERNPYNVNAVVGKAYCLRDTARVAEASRMLESSVDRYGGYPLFHLCRAQMFDRLGKETLAFQYFDELITRYPFYKPAALARADFLKRLGNFEAAKVAYERMRRRSPGMIEALIGLAACLIATGDVRQADRILPMKSPRTKAEWSGYLLRAIMQNELGAHKGAIRLLEKGMERCPFHRSRRVMRSALTALLLQRRKYAEAAKVASEDPGDPLNVIYIHALAANHKTGKAREVFNRTLTGPMPHNVRFLNQQVALLWGLADGPPEKDRAWVAATERTMLLAAA